MSKRLMAVLALFLCGCAQDASDASLDTSRPTDPTEFGYQVSPRTVNLNEGGEAYRTYCIGCHGVTGEGDGLAARWLNPAPRNFKKANFKFISTRFGELPTDEDMFRSISTGLRGSSMPAWGHLPERTRWALVEYIKSFSDIWDREPTPAIPFVTDPYVSNPDKSDAIARGEVAYHGFFRCWNCHPGYVSDEQISAAQEAMGGVAQESYRPDIDQTAIKTDGEGKTIFAPDFLRDQIKSGTSIKDLYRSISAGITGTAMPTWIDAAAQGPVDDEGNALVSQTDLWAVSYYVQDLIKKRTIKFAPDKIKIRQDRKLAFGDEGMVFVAQVQQDEEEEFFEED